MVLNSNLLEPGGSKIPQPHPKDLFQAQKHYFKWQLVEVKEALSKESGLDLSDATYQEVTTFMNQAGYSLKMLEPPKEFPTVLMKYNSPVEVEIVTSKDFSILSYCLQN